MISLKVFPVVQKQITELRKSKVDQMEFIDNVNKLASVYVKKEELIDLNNWMDKRHEKSEMTGHNVQV